MALRPPIQAVIEDQAELDTGRRYWRMVLFNEDGTPFSGGGASAPVPARGRVNGDGTIGDGDGFTVTRNAVGEYTVHFTTPFSARPIVSVDADYSAGWSNVAKVNPAASDADDIKVLTFDSSGNASDTPFEFIAIDPN